MESGRRRIWGGAPTCLRLGRAQTHLLRTVEPATLSATVVECGCRACPELAEGACPALRSAQGDMLSLDLFGKVTLCH